MWVPRLAEHLFAGLPETSVSAARSGRSDALGSWNEDGDVTVLETLLAALHEIDAGEHGVDRPRRVGSRASGR